MKLRSATEDKKEEDNIPILVKTDNIKKEEDPPLTETNDNKKNSDNSNSKEEEHTSINNSNLENEKDRELLNNFYQILYEFDDKEKEKFLFFCTSLKRLPIGGFKKMRPKFAIAKSDQGVPTSSTCVNMLKLPVLPYKKLKDMLRYVINADAGFYYA